MIFKFNRRKGGSLMEIEGKAVDDGRGGRPRGIRAL